MEYYEVNGKVGVLVSHGWGAGWSTWGTPELAYDKRIVEFWLSHKDDDKFMREIDAEGANNAARREAREFFKSIGYEKMPYMGGFDQISLEFVPKGVPFKIYEYDGNETLETFDNAGFMMF